MQHELNTFFDCMCLSLPHFSPFIYPICMSTILFPRLRSHRSGHERWTHILRLFRHGGDPSVSGGHGRDRGKAESAAEPTQQPDGQPMLPASSVADESAEDDGSPAGRGRLLHVHPCCHIQRDGGLGVRDLTLLYLHHTHHHRLWGLRTW